MNDTTATTEGFPFGFSHSIGAIAKALAAAQAELQDANKDSVNPHFKNKFASLSSVRAAVTAVFSKHGLSVVQPFEPHGLDAVCVITMLMHESGEWITSKLVVPVSKRDPQGFGSALSYARRYALAAIANISSDEDDDAEQASKPAAAKAPAATQAAVNVDALVKSLEEANDAKALAEAAVAVGRAKAKMNEADVQRCRAAHDSTMRRLEAA